jgi:hypothetical protein
MKQKIENNITQLQNNAGKTVQLQYRRQAGLPPDLDFGAIKTKLTHDSAIPKLKNMIFNFHHSWLANLEAEKR